MIIKRTEMKYQPMRDVARLADTCTCAEQWLQAVCSGGVSVC